MLLRSNIMNIMSSDDDAADLHSVNDITQQLTNWAVDNNDNDDTVADRLSTQSVDERVCTHTNRQQSLVYDSHSVVVVDLLHAS